MEIKFENKLLGSYKELSHQLKRIQESAESVVPDTKDDIGRIADVNTELLLKSKDLSGRGVRITGEASTVLLYINEAGDKTESLSIRKSFEVEFEAEELENDSLSQVKLVLSNAEARALNPRKVSLTLEISAELSCYKKEDISIESLLPEEAAGSVHVKREEQEVMLTNFVGEKSFVLNEQFTFPTGKPAPRELVFQNPEFCITDAQHIGSKIILKGNVKLDCCYLSDEADYPLKTFFSSDFSQIIDSGEEDFDSFRVLIQPSSSYCELIDTINGEKALDAELHAVLELVSRKKEKISYISDAYSNSMPAEYKMKAQQLQECSERNELKISREELINISETCSDIKCVFTNLSQINATKAKFSALLNLDIIYSSAEGNLEAARRIINIEEELPEINVRILAAKISEIDIKPQGEGAQCSIEIIIKYESSSIKELLRVEELQLHEELAYDTAKIPGLFMVRQDNESLWELAKKYHSSVESIEFMNPSDENPENGLILIAKEI